MGSEISIVTGTRNRYHGLERLIESIHATATVTTEIVIADASDQFSEVHFDANGFVQSIIRFHESPRLYPNRGYNVAFRRAAETRPRYVVYVNDDCEMLPGWDRIAIDFMDEHPRIGLGAIYFADPDGGFNFQTLRWDGGKGRLCYANMGIYRREIGDLVGWFDEREVFVPALGRVECLKFYGNDTGAALRVIDAGYGVVPIPGCKIRHYRENDMERVANSQEFVFGREGNIAGQVLWALWNGDPRREAEEGREYGYRQLQEKHDKFKDLIPASEWL